MTDNLPNTTLWVQGNGVVGNATLTVASGLTNEGTILLESQNGGYSDTLALGSGTFTNASGGTIQVSAGAGGPRTLSGQIANAGTINFDANTTFGGQRRKPGKYRPHQHRRCDRDCGGKLIHQ